MMPESRGSATVWRRSGTFPGTDVATFLTMRIRDEGWWWVEPKVRLGPSGARGRLLTLDIALPHYQPGQERPCLGQPLSGHHASQCRCIVGNNDTFTAHDSARRWQIGKDFEG